MINEYWRSLLDKHGEECYKTLLEGAKVRKDRIYCGWTKHKEATDAYFALIEDHPELFYLANDYRSEYYTSNHPMTQLEDVTVDMIYIYSSPQIRKAQTAIDGHISALRTKTVGMDDREKVIATVEYIVGVTTYEIDNEYNQNAAAALYYGYAQCSGISKATKLLLDAINVKCCTVHGEAIDAEGKKVAHEWCIVTVGGKNYHIDPTFMLGYNPEKRLPYLRAWLFYDDGTLSKTHTWDRSKYPVCSDSSLLINDTQVSPMRALEDAFKSLSNRFGNMNVNQNPIISGPSFSNLREFREFLKKSMIEGKNDVSCRLDIKTSSNDVLVRYIKSAVDMVQDEVDFSTGVSIGVRADGVINLKIQYGDNIGR